MENKTDRCPRCARGRRTLDAPYWCLDCRAIAFLTQPRLQPPPPRR